MARFAQSRRPDVDDDTRRGRTARQQTAAGATIKAVKGLVGGVASGTPEEREAWAADLIPRSGLPTVPCTHPSEANAAKECAWGGGDVREARIEMRAAARRTDNRSGIPTAKNAPWSAPGPTGDRQEHYDDMVNACTPGQKRGLNRALDELTIKWAINALPPTCRWLLKHPGRLFAEGYGAHVQGIRR